MKTGERSEAAAVQEQETEPEVVAEPEAEAETEAEEAPAESGEVVVNEQGEEIYLGFDKGDTTPRTGRKGRTIVDDAERYPSRSELVGGWAGGEVGLQQFVEVRPLLLLRPLHCHTLTCMLRQPAHACMRLWPDVQCCGGALSFFADGCHVYAGGGGGRGGARHGRGSAEGRPQAGQGSRQGRQGKAGGGGPRQVPQQGLHRPLLCALTTVPRPHADTPEQWLYT